MRLFVLFGLLIYIKSSNTLKCNKTLIGNIPIFNTSFNNTSDNLLSISKNESTYIDFICDNINLEDTSLWNKTSKCMYQSNNNLKPIKILSIGDSLTYGIGNLNWVDMLKNKLPNGSILNKFSFFGSTSSDINNILHYNTYTNNDYITILLGSNDALKKDISLFTVSYMSIIHNIQFNNPNAKIILMTIPNINKLPANTILSLESVHNNIKYINTIISSYKDFHNINIIDLYTPLSPNMFILDGIHLNIYGDNQVANLIYNSIYNIHGNFQCMIVIINNSNINNHITIWKYFDTNNIILLNRYNNCLIHNNTCNYLIKSYITNTPTNIYNITNTTNTTNIYNTTKITNIYNTTKITNIYNITNTTNTTNIYNITNVHNTIILINNGYNHTFMYIYILIIQIIFTLYM